MNSHTVKVNAVVIIVVLTGIFIHLSAPTCHSVCVKTETLFVIERSKNRNTVYYDVCIGSDGYPSDAEPVVVYWVLESGETKDLGKLDREFAYGIVEHKKLGKGAVRILIASMKERAITVEKIGDKYVATILIDGKESVLKRVYVKAHELIIGLPRVDFVDLYGITKAGGLPVNERIGKP